MNRHDRLDQSVARLGNNTKILSEVGATDLEFAVTCQDRLEIPECDWALLMFESQVDELSCARMNLVEAWNVCSSIHKWIRMWVLRISDTFHKWQRQPQPLTDFLHSEVGSCEKELRFTHDLLTQHLHASPSLAHVMDEVIIFTRLLLHLLTTSLTFSSSVIVHNSCQQSLDHLHRRWRSSFHFFVTIIILPHDDLTSLLCNITHLIKWHKCFDIATSLLNTEPGLRIDKTEEASLVSALCCAPCAYVCNH